MNIVIEKASPADANALLEYLKQLGGETDNLTFGEEGLPLTVEEEEAYIIQSNNSPNELMLLAKDNGKIIGDAGLSRLPRRLGHRGDLGIGVLKEYWNKGVGTLLLNEVINYAKNNSFEFIDLQVRSDNLAAIHLYEKFGFQKFGEHPAFFKIGRDYIPFDYMYLKIR